MNNNKNYFSLVTDTILIRVSVNVWTGRNKDSVLSAATAHQAGAANDSVESYTVMLDKGDILPLTEIANETRKWLNQNSIVWNSDGWRLVASTDYERVRSHLEGQKAKFLNEVDKLVQRRDELEANAQKKLKSLFKGFPTADALRESFPFNIERDSVKDGADIRLRHVSPSVQAEIENEVNNRNAERTKDSVRQLVNRLLSVVQHAADTLSNEEKVFRNSLVENIRDIVGLIPALNITGDPGIAAIGREIAEQLAKHDADSLRENKAVRREVASSAKSIADKLKNLSAKV